jgi:glycosyltransferase involved in cell wall biosynthesis
MHVCFISQEYPPDTGWGGIGSYTYEMAHGLVDAGHRVTVIARAATKRGVWEDEGVIVHRIFPTPDWGRFRGLWRLNHVWPGFAWSAMRRVREVHRSTPIDVVESAENRADGFFLSFFPASPPRVVRLHTAWIFVDQLNGVHPSFKKRLIYAQEKWTIRRAHAVTAPSKAVVDLTSSWVKFRAQTYVVPNPVNTVTFSPDCNRNSGEILFAGRLEQRKGLRTLIEVVPEVLRRCPGTSFRFVGADGRDEAGRSWRDQVMQKVPASDRSRIRFEHVRRAELVERYQQAAVSVLASEWENFPYAVLESMACETPVVATNVGGLPEFVENGVTGLLIPPNQPPALADALCAMVSDEARRREMGRQARKMVEERFSTACVVPRMISAYSNVLKAPRSAPLG